MLLNLLEVLSEAFSFLVCDEILVEIGVNAMFGFVLGVDEYWLEPIKADVTKFELKIGIELRGVLI